ncbi:hypothetical protein [Egibacter rhizosphaerae]|uniref:hypothetical protein n=1 Tax=Egibacter rhizosphaerae TaxID=1670831 RepID=UPI0013F16D72|nr:hypothetical protein [Egibacter rhizosphaerae]
MHGHATFGQPPDPGGTTGYRCRDCSAAWRTPWGESPQCWHCGSDRVAVYAGLPHQ